MSGAGSHEAGGPGEPASLAWSTQRGREPPDQRPDIDGALGELPSLLARSASAWSFIYDTLDLVAARYGLGATSWWSSSSPTSPSSSPPGGRARLRAGYALLTFARRSRWPPGLYADPPSSGRSQPPV